VETRCGQLGDLPRERREALCPLEAGCDQAGLVVSHEVEGKSAADGCTRSLGGYEDPGGSCSGENPVCECCPGVCGPRVCGVAVRVHQCV